MRTLLVICLASLASGCASVGDFDKAQRDVRPGGEFDQRTKATMNERKTIEADKVRLGDETLRVQRDKERLAQGISAAQADAKQQDDDLQVALDQKRITRAKYDDLKRQQASLQGELQTLRLKDAADQSRNKGAPVDRAAEEAKMRQLDALKARQKKLESDLSKALKG